MRRQDGNRPGVDFGSEVTQSKLNLKCIQKLFSLCQDSNSPTQYSSGLCESQPDENQLQDGSRLTFS